MNVRINGVQHCLCGRVIPIEKIGEAHFSCRLLKCTECGLYVIAGRICAVTGYLQLIKIKGKDQLIEANHSRTISKN